MTQTVDLYEQDGKTFAPIDQLYNWEENPRTASDQEIERLADEIEKLGFYKPIIATPEGEVIGGSMRLRALRTLDADAVWVSVVEPESEDQKLEYALSDNDRVGHYEEDKLANLIQKRDIDIGQFKVDFYSPQDIAQNMARAMDPEELLKKTSNGEDDDTSSTTSSEDTSEEKDAQPRSLENLGKSAGTAMIQLYMGQGEKDEFVERVEALKSVYGAETTSDVAFAAVKREYKAHGLDD